MVVAGAMARFSASRQRILPSDCGSDFQGDDFTDQLVAITLSDTVFGFLGSGHGSAESSGSESGNGRFDDPVGEEEEEEEDEDGSSSERSKVYWENQHKLLKETLCKSGSLEREIRNAAKTAMMAVRDDGKFCVCRGEAADDGSCRSCLMREMSRRLRDAGYDSAVCKSKWKSSPEIPSGEHTFIDVLDNSNPEKGQVRIIIELNFRAEFEMARASQEYNDLAARLPEAFVGKAERLRALVKILSSAAKKCMKDKKMHMGPWRKSKYMLAKWSSTCHRMEDKPLPPLATDHPNKLATKPKASMLTIALHDLGSRVQPKAVTVV